MPINPFQTVAEMSWGQYDTKKAGRIQSPQGSQSLAGQGHRSRQWTPGYTESSLGPTPQAKGTLSMGKADIGRPDYGRGAPEAPKREGRRTAFGGMGPGATRGGGSGMTAGGNISFDLSIGKRDFTGADMKGARYAEEGSSAVLGDTKTDNRMYDNRKLEMNAGDGGDATSGDAKATGATPGATPGSSRAPRAPRTPEQRQARNTRDRARRAELKASGTTPGAGTTATSGDAKGGAGGGFSGDALAVAERFISGESSMTNNATTNVGTGNSRDTSKKSSRSSRTDVRASGEGVASADTSTTDARRTPAAKEKPATTPATKKPDKKTTAATEAKVAETEARSDVKDKAKSDLAKATKKRTTPPAAATKSKGASKSKKKTAGGVTKEEEEE